MPQFTPTPEEREQQKILDQVGKPGFEAPSLPGGADMTTAVGGPVPEESPRFEPGQEAERRAEQEPDDTESRSDSQNLREILAVLKAWPEKFRAIIRGE